MDNHWYRNTTECGWKESQTYSLYVMGTVSEEQRDSSVKLAHSNFVQWTKNALGTSHMLAPLLVARDREKGET